MSLPTAMLNQMANSGSASKSRKRKLISVDIQTPPNKRQVTSPNDGTGVQAGNDGGAQRPKSVKSKTSLPRASIGSTATPAHQNRLGPNVYEPPVSPEESEARVSQAKGKEKEREAAPVAATKTKIRRLANKKKDNASPFKSVRFGQLNSLGSDAILSSFNSPAKRAKSTRSNPLHVLRSLPSSAPQDLEPVVEEANDHEPTKAGSVATADRAQHLHRSPVVVVAPDNCGHSADLSQDDAAPSGSDEPLDSGAEDVTRAEAHISTRQVRSPSARRRASIQPPQELEHPQNRPLQGEAEEAQDSGEDNQEAPKSSQTRRGRPAMSQEDRRAKRAAEARKRAENAEETEAAEIEDFDRRAKQFVSGIEDIVDQPGIGGIEAWSQLGGGAKTITAMVAKKGTMDTDRAQTVWWYLKCLSDGFRGITDMSEEQIVETITNLKANATWKFLTRQGTNKSGDRTVVDLFEQIIPHSVYVLKHNLRSRFDSGFRLSWEELLSLVDIVMALCETAQQWSPRPSTLESGIKREVRNHIRPALSDIRYAISMHLSGRKSQERVRRDIEKLAERQRRSKAQRLQGIEALEARLTSHLPPIPAKRHTDANASGMAAIDIDDLTDELENDRDVDREFAPPSRPRRTRQATEEIPAPDPVTWTEEEQIALLEGLQIHSGTERYARILETSEKLATKDIDQCIARARYYKQACQAELAREAANGGHSYDWLRSV